MLRAGVLIPHHIKERGGGFKGARSNLWTMLMKKRQSDGPADYSPLFFFWSSYDCQKVNEKTKERQPKSRENKLGQLSVNRKRDLLLKDAKRARVQ